MFFDTAGRTLNKIKNEGDIQKPFKHLWSLYSSGLSNHTTFSLILSGATVPLKGQSYEIFRFK